MIALEVRKGKHTHQPAFAHHGMWVANGQARSIRRLDRDPRPPLTLPLLPLSQGAFVHCNEPAYWINEQD